MEYRLDYGVDGTQCLKQFLVSSSSSVGAFWPFKNLPAKNTNCPVLQYNECQSTRTSKYRRIHLFKNLYPSPPKLHRTMIWFVYFLFLLQRANCHWPSQCRGSRSWIWDRNALMWILSRWTELLRRCASPTVEGSLFSIGKGNPGRSSNYVLVANLLA